MGNSARRDAKAIVIAERRRSALELRKAGASYEQIADKLAYADKSNARRDIHAAIKEIIAEPAEEVRALELARLDALLLGHWSKAKGGDTAATDRVMKIMERRSAYLGLDAPTKVNANVSNFSKLTDDELKERWKALTGVEYAEKLRNE